MKTMQWGSSSGTCTYPDLKAVGDTVKIVKAIYTLQCSVVLDISCTQLVTAHLTFDQAENYRSE